MTNGPRSLTLPPDLGAQIGRDTLARLVQQTAGTCAARLAPELPRRAPTGTASGCGLLGLLTYCYASGVLSSRAITEMAEADPVAKGFCGDAIPERDEIAGFRRDHRALIQECMKQVYEAAWQVMVDVRQINARISQAAQMDCWSRDW